MTLGYKYVHLMWLLFVMFSGVGIELVLYPLLRPDMSTALNTSREIIAL